MRWQGGLGVACDLEKAESWLYRATAQDNPVAWNNLGTLFMTKGENEKSKQCYQKAVALGFASATHLAKE
jgi:TPR repeat protein